MFRSKFAAALTAILILAIPGAAVSADKSRKAVVAGGQTVELIKSRFSSRELAARRPQMEALIPRKR